MTARLLLAAAVALLPLASAPAAFAEKEWAVTLLGGQYSGSKLLETSVAIGGGLSVGVRYRFWAGRAPAARARWMACHTRSLLAGMSS